MKQTPPSALPFAGAPWPAAEALLSELASPQAESRAFWRVRQRLIRTIFWQTVFRARFRLVLILVL